jgi:ATP-dependent RNA helicase DHX57
MFAEDQSDHLTTLNAYNAWMDARSMGRAAEMAFTRDNFLSFRTLAGAVHVDSP